MTMPRPTLIVLTPVKNEAWILDRFLAVCSQFADLILIADQQSTDGSREIAARWPKVALIDNPNPAYDEADRQKLLIEEARRRVPGPRAFLTLDADEIVAADAPESPDWQAFLQAAPGTVLMLEKLDLYPTAEHCVRYDKPFPYGYVDDGAEHQPRWIHSYRVPVRPESPRFTPAGIKLLHYANLRPKTQRLKTCMYTVMENLKAPLRPRSILSRRINYARNKDWIGEGWTAASDPAWFLGWEAAGIEMFQVSDSDESWQGWACLRAMARHGERRFWFDDIWDVDWEQIRQRGLRLGITDLPAQPIECPPGPLLLAMEGASFAAHFLKPFVGR